MDRLTRQIVMATAAGSAPFAPVTHTYNGASGTETIPSGAGQMVIEIWGGGGPGGQGSNLFDSQFGGGGGSGGYSKRTLGLTAGDWGKTLPYVAGLASQNSSVTNGTYATAVAMTANAGGAGDNGASSGAQGDGGTASGGDVNTTGGGSSLSIDQTGAAAPNGGAAQPNAGTAGNAPGGGGGGGDPGPAAGGAGAPGRVKFSYT